MTVDALEVAVADGWLESIIDDFVYRGIVQDPVGKDTAARAPTAASPLCAIGSFNNRHEPQMGNIAGCHVAGRGGAVPQGTKTPVAGHEDTRHWAWFLQEEAPPRRRRIDIVFSLSHSAR